MAMTYEFCVVLRSERRASYREIVEAMETRRTVRGRTEQDERLLDIDTYPLAVTS